MEPSLDQSSVTHFDEESGKKIESILEELVLVSSFVKLSDMRSVAANDSATTRAIENGPKRIVRSIASSRVE